MNFIAVGKKSSTFCRMNIVFIFQYLKYMRYWQRNILFDPDGRKTKREELTTGINAQRVIQMDTIDFGDIWDCQPLSRCDMIAKLFLPIITEVTAI